MSNVLDVGCGVASHGTVNVDRFRFSPETSGKRDSLVKTEANVIGVGEALPFKSESFDIVVSFHVIEHSTNPARFLSELIRVAKTKGEVILSCPHRYSVAAKSRFHRCYFNAGWFEKALRGVPHHVSLQFCFARKTPPWIGLDILVRIWK